MSDNGIYCSIINIGDAKDIGLGLIKIDGKKSSPLIFSFIFCK